jgi:hypothetical protein
MHLHRVLPHRVHDGARKGCHNYLGIHTKEAEATHAVHS